MEDSIARALNNNLSSRSIVLLSQRSNRSVLFSHIRKSFFFQLESFLTYRCMCTSGYTGQNCENEYIPCNPSPCKNGGTCHQTDDLDYECICPEGEFWNCFFGFNYLWSRWFYREGVDDSAYTPNSLNYPLPCEYLHRYEIFFSNLTIAPKRVKIIDKNWTVKSLLKSFLNYFIKQNEIS